MTIDEIYKNLTSIDIEQQKRLWNERGKGYYGEYLVFRNLFSLLKGTSKILMNLEIPVNDHKKTEIDLLLIHETGLYVFEVKHYKGTIYGKSSDDKWTQYFRTAKNNVFRNPIMQNAYHIKVLQEYYPEMPIYSLIVFTNDDCELKITNFDYRIDVCKLQNMAMFLNNRFRINKPMLTMEKIDEIFNELCVYSQMNETVEIKDEVQPIINWLKPFVDALNIEKNKVIEQYNANQKVFLQNQQKLKKSKKLGFILIILVVIICTVMSSLCIFAIEEDYSIKLQKTTEELEYYKQYHLNVQQPNNENFDDLYSLMVADSVDIKPLSEDAVSFSAVLKSLTDDYSIQFQENAKYIAITKNEKIFECNVFDSTLTFNAKTSIMKSGVDVTTKLKTKKFYGISDPNDIVQIKVVNVRVLKNDADSTVLKDNLQFVIYSK